MWFCLLTTTSTEITVAVMQFTAKGRESLRNNCVRFVVGRQNQQDNELCGGCRAQQCRAAVDVTREHSLGSHLRKLLSFSGTAGGWDYCHSVHAKHLEGYWGKGLLTPGFIHVRLLCWAQQLTLCTEFTSAARLESEVGTE